MHPNNQTDWSNKIGMVFNLKILKLYANMFFLMKTVAFYKKIPISYKKHPFLIKNTHGLLLKKLNL